MSIPTEERWREYMNGCLRIEEKETAFWRFFLTLCFLYPTKIIEIWEHMNWRETWMVMPDVDAKEELLLKMPAMNNCCDEETAMRRAKYENLEFIICCSGRKMGLVKVNKDWREHD
jgi:hypothetical protein